ncbi:TIGR02300 family protein [Rhodopila sp.]|uniref:TIGR02300 family protein n=1 Tax=Rhodopila sp. TaxID=2480087 RepID=UPI003D0B3E1D
MAKPELGTKRVCVSCNTRFYDLAKSPAVCPKCGTEQPVEQPRPRRTGGNVVEDKRPKKPVPTPEDVDVEVEGVEDVEEEDVLEAADDLEDDADAISGDIEVETDTDEHER